MYFSRFIEENYKNFIKHGCTQLQFSTSPLSHLHRTIELKYFFRADGTSIIKPEYFDKKVIRLFLFQGASEETHRFHREFYFRFSVHFTKNWSDPFPENHQFSYEKLLSRLKFRYFVQNTRTLGYTPLSKNSKTTGF